MATAPLWIKQTFKDLRLVEVKPKGNAVEKYRSEIESCKLQDAMHKTHGLINTEAGRMVLYEELFIQPQYLICRYTFESSNVNYEMALALRADGPTLVFSLYRLNRVFDHAAIQRVYERLVQQGQRTIKHELRVYPPIVNNIDLREWFTYLLSGLRNSRKPLAKNMFLTNAG